MIAVKERTFKAKQRAEDAEKRAANKAKIKNTQLTNIKTFIDAGGKKDQVSLISRIHATDRALWEASLQERLDDLLEEHIEAAKSVWRKEESERLADSEGPKEK